MHASVTHFVGIAFRQNAPEIAQDASPAEVLRAAIRRLTRRWTTKFNDASQKMASWFAQSVNTRSDAALKKILKDAGISVEFQMTAAQRDILQATVNANVSLIRSIPQKYLSDVEGMVMRSVQTGRDIGGLTKDLEKTYGISRKRAEFIAFTQNQMATSALQRARQVECGITKALWRHSSGGRVPRVAHLEMNGQEYEVAKGMWDRTEKKFVLPGFLPRCRCSSLPIVEGFTY